MSARRRETGGMSESRPLARTWALLAVLWMAGTLFPASPPKDSKPTPPVDQRPLQTSVTGLSRSIKILLDAELKGRSGGQRPFNTREKTMKLRHPGAWAALEKSLAEASGQVAILQARARKTPSPKDDRTAGLVQTQFKLVQEALEGAGIGPLNEQVLALKRAQAMLSPDQPLWQAIRDHSDAVPYDQYDPDEEVRK